MQALALFKDIYFGGVYSDEYEEFSDGGPRCFNSMTVQFRIVISLISGIINFSIIYFSWPRIKRSKELDVSLVKDLTPCLAERFLGYLCYLTYLVQTSYKFFTRRVIFMHNPCHYVLLFSAILLTTKKTRTTSIIFISYLRWLFGPNFAIIFPVTNGLDLPFEKEAFWVEHYLAALIAPIALVLFGRYGFFKEPFWTLAAHQFFGFSCHILYMRLLMMPQSLLTWANLNFTLCHPECDPTIKIWGNYYYFLGDYYLNLASIVTLLFLGLLYLVIYYITKLPSILFTSTPKAIKQD